jgi:proteasome accessory factor A
VSRQIFCGAGRVGLEQDSSSTGFQISQRADFFEAEVGLETTLKRPIINTRDEPHADPEAYRRFHVIVGDANMCDFANYLKVGVTALVIFALESGWLESNSLKLESPLLSLREVSRDLDLDVKLSLARGGKTTALEIQRQFFSQIEAALNEDAHAQLPWVAALMSAWQQTLESLEREPMSLVGSLDWVTKKWIIDGYRKRDNLDWSDPRLVAVDLQWSDLSPEKGLAMVLRRRGTIKSLVSNEQASWAAVNPPPQTRAWFRGEVLRRFANCVAAASWDSLIVDVPGRESLVRVPTLDPFKGTKEHVGHLMSKCEDIGQLLVNLDG